MYNLLATEFRKRSTIAQNVRIRTVNMVWKEQNSPRDTPVINIGYCSIETPVSFGRNVTNLIVETQYIRYQ